MIGVESSFDLDVTRRLLAGAITGAVGTLGSEIMETLAGETHVLSVPFEVSSASVLAPKPAFEK